MTKRERTRDSLSDEVLEFLAAESTRPSVATKKPSEPRVALTVRLDPDMHARLKVALVHRRAQKVDGPRTAQDLFEYLVGKWLEQNGTDR